MKIAFIVEFPTQFEVPFYQYVSKRLKAEGEKLKVTNEEFDSVQSALKDKEQRGRDFDSAQSDKDENFESDQTGLKIKEQRGRDFDSAQSDKERFNDAQPDKDENFESDQPGLKIKEQRGRDFDTAQPDKEGFNDAQPDKDENFESTQTEIKIKEQRGRDFDSAQSDKVYGKEFDFHVIYNNTDQGDYHDFELGKKVGWGFNLYEGYTYFIADKENIVNSISKILEREKYDFVILNGYKNSYTGLTKLCKQKHIPIALRIDSVLYNLSPIKKLLKRLYFPFAYRQFNHFFAVGSETKQFLNWLGIGDEKISYFSYSVDEEWFRKKADDTTKIDALKQSFKINQEKVLLSVAKFVPRESPWDILKAFGLLNDIDLVLLLVGDGEDRIALENYAKRMPHLKIIFTGYVPYQELGYYYGVATIFIHAAKNEPWGVSVHEAISCGCTVITSDKVGSSKDLIIEGENGFTYPFSDVKQLTKNIQESLIINPIEKDKTNTSILKEWGYAKMWEEIKSFT